MSIIDLLKLYQQNPIRNAGVVFSVILQAAGWWQMKNGPIYTVPCVTSWSNIDVYAMCHLIIHYQYLCHVSLHHPISMPMPCVHLFIRYRCLCHVPPHDPISMSMPCVTSYNTDVYATGHLLGRCFCYLYSWISTCFMICLHLRLCRSFCLPVSISMLDFSPSLSMSKSVLFFILDSCERE